MPQIEPNDLRKDPYSTNQINPTTMAQVELVMPKMGESIIEATILNWVKNVGDTVEADETILEIATDKVDSEVPSPVDGKLAKVLFEPDAIVAVGQVIAIIETDAEATVAAGPATGETVAVPAEATEPSRPKISAPTSPNPAPASVPAPPTPPPVPSPGPVPQPAAATAAPSGTVSATAAGRFYSPLVRTMANKEGIGQAELNSIPGTGKNGRVNKADMLAYLKRRDNSFVNGTRSQQFGGEGAGNAAPAAPATPSAAPAPTASLSGQDEIIAMDRMRKLIGQHMVDSKRTSPHVTSFIEVDVTDIVNWRNKVKVGFQKQHGQKITFTPIFIEAVAKAIKDYPLVNVSVDGDKHHQKRQHQHRYGRRPAYR